MSDLVSALPHPPEAPSSSMVVEDVVFGGADAEL